MADDTVKEPEKNNKDRPVPPPQRPDIPQGQKPQEGSPLPFSIKDTTTIGHSVKPQGDDVDPQLIKDFDNAEKSFVMIARAEVRQLNEPLAGRVCGIMVNIAEEARSSEHLPDRIQIRLEACVVKFLDMSEKYMDQIGTNLSPMLEARPNMDDERRLNEFGGILASLYRAGMVLLNSAAGLKFSSNTVIRIQSGIEKARHLDEQILHIATKKGYALKSLDEAVRMAEQEGNEYSFTVNDVAQEKLLSAMKEESTQLLANIRRIMDEEADKKEGLINASAMLKLSELKRELAAFERQYVKGLTEKKIRDKMKAEVIVLAYLLKNPSSLTPKRLAEIGDEINKIKWQAYPRFA